MHSSFVARSSSFVARLALLRVPADGPAAAAAITAAACAAATASAIPATAADRHRRHGCHRHRRRPAAERSRSAGCAARAANPNRTARHAGRSRRGFGRASRLGNPTAASRGRHRRGCAACSAGPDRSAGRKVAPVIVATVCRPVGVTASGRRLRGFMTGRARRYGESGRSAVVVGRRRSVQPAAGCSSRVVPWSDAPRHRGPRIALRSIRAGNASCVRFARGAMVDMPSADVAAPRPRRTGHTAIVAGRILAGGAASRTSDVRWLRRTRSAWTPAHFRARSAVRDERPRTPGIATAIRVAMPVAREHVDDRIAVPPERTPADVAGRRPPIHPRRAPALRRDPEPATRRVRMPAAVVMRRPAPGIVRDPRPSVARHVMPAAVVVRAPADGDGRIPDRSRKSRPTARCRSDRSVEP